MKVVCLLLTSTFSINAHKSLRNPVPEFVPARESCDGNSCPLLKLSDVLQNIQCLENKPVCVNITCGRYFQTVSWSPGKDTMTHSYLPPPPPKMRNVGRVAHRFVRHPSFLTLTLLILLVLGSVWLMCRSVYLSGLLMSHGTDSVRTRRATIVRKQRGKVKLDKS